MKDLLDLPDPFEAEVWADPVHDLEALDAFGPYAEEFWLPTVGPTTYVLARRLLNEPGEWQKVELAASVGIKYRGGTKCPLERSLARLEGYRLATDSGGKLHVRSRWPRLPRNLLAKLPTFLQEEEPAMAANARGNAA